MTLNMGGITIDCAEPRKLAELWTKALGTTVGQDYGGEFLFLEPVGAHTVPGLTWTVLQDPEGNEFCVGSTNG